MVATQCGDVLEDCRRKAFAFGKSVALVKVPTTTYCSDSFYLHGATDNDIEKIAVQSVYG